MESRVPPSKGAEPGRGVRSPGAIEFVVSMILLLVGAGFVANAAWLAGGRSSNVPALQAVCPNGPRPADAAVRALIGFSVFLVATVIALRAERAAKTAKARETGEPGSARGNA